MKMPGRYQHGQMTPPPLDDPEWSLGSTENTEGGLSRAKKNSENLTKKGNEHDFSDKKVV